MDAFYASVEQHDHPEYRGKPVVVGAPRDRRGVVSAASYEARIFGIHSAMPSREAARLCPHAIFLPVNGTRYGHVSRQVFAILERFTPLVEPVSIDEAFLNVTGARALLGTGEEIAEKIRAAVREETGLTCSVGVAPNKFLAKLASDMNKPDGLTVVPSARADILAFLAPLPVNSIWGIGKVGQRELERVGITTIGDLQAVLEGRLAKIVGRHAAGHLRRLAFGEDAREVEVEREEKSISHEHTFDVDCGDVERLEQTLRGLAEGVGRRLRASGRYANLARLKLRWSDFQTITRQRPFPEPTCDDMALRHAALDLFRAEDLVQDVRLVGFGVTDLQDTPQQQMLLFDSDDGDRLRRESLSRAVDQVRDRFGSRGIGTAPGADRPPDLWQVIGWRSDQPALTSARVGTGEQRLLMTDHW